MSEFSEKCKEIIEENSTNIYRISKASGLDRTTLQKMVKGSRLPSQTFLDEFCSYLGIKKSQRSELNHLFHIEKVGKATYLRRQEVEKLIANFNNVAKSMRESNYFRRTVTIPTLTDGMSVRALSMEVDVIDALRYITISAFEDEKNVHIYMNDFNKSFYIMQQMIQETKERKCIASCHQIIKIEKNPVDSRRNIGKLQYIFPFAINFQGEYDVRYTYIATDEEYLEYSLWPHYVITGSKVLLLSADEKKGLLIENERIALSYLEEQKRIQKQAKPLISYKGNDELMMSFYSQIATEQTLICSYETTPCVAKLGEIAIMDQKYDGIDIIETYRETYRQLQEDMNKKYKYHCIYRFNGMEEFIKEGKLPGVIGQYFECVPMKDRKQMISKR